MPGRSSVSDAPKERFTGHELDDETGLIYAGKRYYMPAVGRWMTVDPLAEKFPGWSPYNYVLNNPVKLFDPDGQAPCCDGVDPSIGVRVLVTAVYDVKHSAQNLILNSAIGQRIWATEEGMKWQAGYARDASGNEVFETEIRQVPRGGALAEGLNSTLDAVNVVAFGRAPGSSLLTRTPGATTQITSLVKQDNALLKLAKQTFKGNTRLQDDANSLIQQLSQGNLDPGIGTKNVFGNVFEARSRSGARVYFREGDNGIEVVGYSSKHNQQKVINRLKELYED